MQNLRRGAVYKRQCYDCDGAKIGETGNGNTTKRLQRKTRKTTLPTDRKETGYDIDWNSVRCPNHEQRLTLEY